MIYFHKQNDHIFNAKKNGIENSKKRFRKSMLLMSLFFTMVIALFISCGSGGDSDMTTEMGSDLLSGSFLDSAVEGLHYETATQSGTTDMDGMFTYLNGEVIRFLIGDVMLGEGQASQYMTPVDLAPGAYDEMHPMVTNISRFLQTMDLDSDPSNGIFIPETLKQEMMGRSLLFEMTIEDFEDDPDVVMLMNALNAMGGEYSGRLMIAPEVAQTHMRKTLAEMMQMMSGASSIENTGVILDSAVEGLYYETGTLSGVTDAVGTFSYMFGEIVKFYIGDVLIGQALGKPFLTPVDLVPGATNQTHPTVTNISRFLQTLDMDGDTSNGIFIPESVVNEMQGRHIDFNIATEKFEMAMEVVMLMDAISALDPAYYRRIMVSSESAQTHLGETLAGMLDNENSVNTGDNDDAMTGGNTSNGGDMMNGGNVSGGGMM